MSLEVEEDSPSLGRAVETLVVAGRVAPLLDVLRGPDAGSFATRLVGRLSSARTVRALLDRPKPDFAGLGALLPLLGPQAFVPVFETLTESDDRQHRRAAFDLLRRAGVEVLPMVRERLSDPAVGRDPEPAGARRAHGARARGPRSVAVARARGRPRASRGAALRASPAAAARRGARGGAARSRPERARHRAGVGARGLPARGGAGRDRDCGERARRRRPARERDARARIGARRPPRARPAAAGRRPRLETAAVDVGAAASATALAALGSLAAAWGQDCRAAGALLRRARKSLDPQIRRAAGGTA